MHEFVRFNPNLTYDDDKSQIIQLKIRTAAAGVAPKNIFCVFWGY